LVKRKYLFVTRNTYVCIEHFVDESFEHARVRPCVQQDLQAELFNLQRPRKLRPYAVPTKFKYFARVPFDSDQITRNYHYQEVSKQHINV